jgi:dTDP-glucose pyrophosphorylase/predicted transcriptional regulator
MSTPEKLWRQVILPLDASIQDAIRNLNESSLKIVIAVNEQGQLEGTVSDGDIRRALLKGLDLGDRLERVMHRDALVAPPSLGRELILQLMRVNKIQQIPVVDEVRQVVGLHLWEALSNPPERPNVMVIMAGGKGTRLRPFTENCPKPLVVAAGKPMMEHIIERAKLEGFSRFVISIQYLGHMIEEYFGNGERLGVQIDYLREQTPLGTAGALSLMAPRPGAPFVVTNGDVLTDIRYGEMLEFHVRHDAMATMAVRLHEWQHPFGVVQTRGVEIVGFEEKPIARTHINAGVYVLEPESLESLEHGAPCDMPTLFERLQVKARRIVAYPMHEPWLDIGRPDDLSRANA